MGAEPFGETRLDGRARWSLVCLTLGIALVAEGVVAERFGVGGRFAFGWGRFGLIAVGGALVLAGVVMVVKGWVPRPGRATIVHVGRTLWPFAAALAVYMSAFVIMQPITVGDQPHYELESMSLAFDHDRNLANNYVNPAQYHIMFGLQVPKYEAYAYTNRHALIFDENVGLPLVLALGVPWVELAESYAPRSAQFYIYAPLSARSPWNIEIVILAAIAAHVLYRLLRRFRPGEPGLTVAVWACTMFCAPMMVYASQIYPEVPVLLLALITADCLTRTPTAASGAIGATAAAAMPWLHVRFFLVAALLVLALAARAIAHQRSLGRPPGSLVKVALPVLLPFVVSTAAMAIAFQAWYGSPLITAPYRLAQTHQPQALANLYPSITNLILNPQTAALPFAPVGLLALAAIPLFCRRFGRWALFALFVAAVYIVAVAFEGATIGSSFPGRYMIWLLPFGAVPLLFIVIEFRLARLIFVFLGCVTAEISLAVVLEPAGSVSAVTTSRSAWTGLVNIWPTIDAAHPYANAATIIAWAAGVVLAAAVAYVAGARRGPGIRPARPLSP